MRLKREDGRVLTECTQKYTSTPVLCILAGTTNIASHTHITAKSAAFATLADVALIASAQPLRLSDPCVCTHRQRRVGA